MDRRGFIKSASFGSGAMLLGIPALGSERKIKIGLIGAGWYGMVITKAALSVGGVEIIGVCDVDSGHLKNSADEIATLQGSRPKTFKYYQELLEMKDLEVIFIGTPPQWHALQFIDACRKGFDIFCEKPLSYDVREGMAMVEAAKKAGNIVQIGFQRRQSNAFTKAKELIEEGRMGNIRQITAQIHYIPGPQDTTIQAPPPSLDWEEWCGPAPKLDYRPNIGHKAWRLEKEYGNGHLVDWGVHHIDIIRRIMGESMPETFFTQGGIFEWKNKITTPDTLTAHMAFKKAPVVWQHRLWGTGDPNREFNNGIFFHGEKATLFASDTKLIIFNPGREGKAEEMAIPTQGMQEKHVENFLTAVRTRNKGMLSSTPEDALQSSATVQLAMISYNTNSLVSWDQSKMEITDNQQASALLKREYRGKYTHPYRGI